MFSFTLFSTAPVFDVLGSLVKCSTFSLSGSRGNFLTCGCLFARVVCDFCLVIGMWPFALSVSDCVVALVGGITFPLFGKVGGVMTDEDIFGGVSVFGDPGVFDDLRNFGDLSSFDCEMRSFFACSSPV